MKNIVGRITLLLATFTACFGVLGCNSEGSNQPTKKSSSLVMSKDLGLVKQDQARTHTFDVQNDLSSDVQVVSIQKSCGCILCDIKPGMTLPAKATTPITLEIAKDRRGPQSASVLIKTDSTDHQTGLVKLTLSAEIERDFWTKPNWLTLYGTRPEIIELHFSDLEFQDELKRTHSIRENVIVQFLEEREGLIRFSVQAQRIPSKSGAVKYDVIRFGFHEERAPLFKMPVAIFQASSSHEISDE